MDDNITIIRICYRASDVAIVAKHNQTELWQQTHVYAKHQTWLQQVYRTLIETDHHTACLHEISADAPLSTWQSASDEGIAASTAITPQIWAHVICLSDDESTYGDTEYWIRYTAQRYAAMGQRINGILSPANCHYVNYLLQHHSRFLSGAFFGHNGIMIRNGCITSERTLAYYWHAHTARQTS